MHLPLTVNALMNGAFVLCGEVQASRSRPHRHAILSDAMYLHALFRIRTLHVVFVSLLHAESCPRNLFGR